MTRRMRKRPGQPPNALKCPICKGKYPGGTLELHPSTSIKNGKRYVTKIWRIQHHIYENGKSKTKECYLGVNAKQDYPNLPFPE